MTIKSKIFFCLQCNNISMSKDDVQHHECKSPFEIIQANVTFEVTLTPWRRFVHWFFSLDIGWFLAFMGLVIVNTILVTKLGLSFKLSLIEGLGLGFAIPRLLK